MTSDINVRTEGAYSKVIVDGHDITKRLQGVSFSHRCGDLAKLDLEVLALDVTEISAEATVRVLISGVEFTQEDVDGLLGEADLCERVQRQHTGGISTARSIAERLAQLLPPPPLAITGPADDG